MERAPLYSEQALAAVPFFSMLVRDDLVALARVLHIRDVAADGVICRIGEPGDAFFIVRTGWVQITRPQAGSELLLNLLGPGECFGELALLDGQPRSATARALEPSALWVLTRNDFLTYLSEHPRATLALLAVMSTRLRHLTDRVAEASFVGLAQRLARRIADLALQRGVLTLDGVELGSGVTADWLAALLGVSPLRVRLILRAWQQEGLLRIEDGDELTILRGEELLRIAN